MKLKSIIRDLQFDKRIMEWNIRYNLITHQEYQKYLNALPDVSDDKEPIIDINQLEKTEDHKKE
ncbi:MAG: hypothetical protein OXM55_02755 [Bdellovibrionales bacterium]|nr:hypothetical protein [Bdellovibrionales bacterium]